MVVRYDTMHNGKLIKCAEFDGFVDQLSYIYNFILDNKFNTPKLINKCNDFYGKHSLKETIKGMNYGFKENTSYFLNVMSKMKSKTQNINGIYMDYEGFAYDMGAVLSGEPECCLNIGHPLPTPCIKIVIDIAWSSHINAKQIYNRGIAITNLINTLLMNGCIVDLFALRYNIQSDMNILYTTKIDTKVLSIENIAFACSPEYFRKIGWITTDMIRDKKSEDGRGMSQATDFLLNKIKNEKIFFIGGDYTDYNIQQNLHDIETANNYIFNSFKEYCEKNKINITFDKENE